MTQKFYRYRSLIDWDANRFLSEMQDLEENAITFVSPDLFNDPHDCQVFEFDFIQNRIQKVQKIIFDKANEEVEKIKSINPFLDINYKTGEQFFYWISRVINICKKNNIESNEIVSFFTTDVIKIFSNTIKPALACFTQNALSMYFWSHYAKAHKGYAIEYEFKSMFENDGKLSPKKVIYKNTLSNDDYNIFNCYDDFYFLKSTHWKQEKEYRLIGCSLNENEECVRISNKSIYNIKAIYLGLDFDETSTTGGYLLKIANQKKYDVYTVKKRVNSFELVAEKVVI